MKKQWNRLALLASTCVIVGLVFPVAVFAADVHFNIPNIGTRLQDFVPLGYAIFEKIEMDINGDGRKDIAVVLSKGADSLEPRPLLILLAQPKGGYSLFAYSNKLAPGLAEMGIANTNGGGVLSRKENVLIVTRYGGGAPVTFSHKYFFKFQKGELSLIKKIYEQHYPDETCNVGELAKGEYCYLVANTITENLQTGSKVESWVKYGKGKLSKSRSIRSFFPKQNLQRFADFEPEE